METGRIAPQEYDGNTVMNPAYKNWSAFYHEDSINYPLMHRLFAVPEYRQRFLAHLRTLINEDFTSTSADAVIDGYAAQINALVQGDPKKLYTYADFQNEIPILKNFIIDRRNFLNSNPEVAEIAPAIGNVAWFVGGTPWITPGIGQGATVRSSATCASGLYDINMYYSSALVGNFTKIRMLDDGLNDDGAAGDGIYGAAIPGQAFGNWIRFYIEAIANNSAKSVAYDPPGAEHNVYAYQIGGVNVTEISDPAMYMSIFPNPAGNTAGILVNNNSEEELTIVNSVGQQVYKEKFRERVFVDVSRLPSGIYFVKCGTVNQKLIVQH